MMGGESGCNLLAKIWRITGCSKSSLQYSILKLRGIAFRICITWVGQMLTVLPVKLFFYKKSPKYGLFRATRFWLSWLWKELEAEPVTSGQHLGHPWNVWDITLQMSYVEAWWHQNWVHSRPILCRGGGTRKSVKICVFFIKRSVAPNLQIETFLGPAPTDSPRTQLSEYL